MVAGAEILVEFLEQNVAIVDVGSKEYDRIAIGDTGPDTSAELGADNLIELRMKNPRRLDGLGADRWKTHIQSAVRRRCANNFRIGGLLQILHRLQVEFQGRDAPALQVGMEDETKCFWGIDGVARDKVGKPWCSNNLLELFGRCGVQASGLLSGMKDGVRTNHGKQCCFDVVPGFVTELWWVIGELKRGLDEVVDEFCLTVWLLVDFTEQVVDEDVHLTEFDMVVCRLAVCFGGEPAEFADHLRTQGRQTAILATVDTE